MVEDVRISRQGVAVPQTKEARTESRGWERLNKAHTRKPWMKNKTRVKGKGQAAGKNRKKSQRNTKTLWHDRHKPAKLDTEGRRVFYGGVMSRWAAGEFNQPETRETPRD